VKTTEQRLSILKPRECLFSADLLNREPTVSAGLSRVLSVFMVCILASMNGCSRPKLPDDKEALFALMNSDDLEVAVRATQRLDELYGKDALLEALKRGSPQVRSWAAAALQAHPGSDSREALLSCLADRSPEVRSKAVIALRSMCDQTCLPHVAPLEHDEDETVRVVAKATIAELRKK